MNDENIIGGNIRKIRKSKNMTMKELGEKIGVSEQAIGNYERGDREPNIETLKKIAKVLNINWVELVGPHTLLKFNSSIDDGEILYSSKIKKRVMSDLFDYCRLENIDNISKLNFEDEEFVFENILHNFVSLSKKCASYYKKETKPKKSYLKIAQDKIKNNKK